MVKKNAEISVKVTKLSVVSLFEEKFLYRYGTHYIHSAEFGGQILFENTKVASAQTSINEMVEKSYREIQSSFGSSTGVRADVSIPLNAVSADFGGSFKNIVTNDNVNKQKNDRVLKASNT